MRTPFTLLTLGLSLVSLAACEMYAESRVNDRRMQVREEKLVEEIPTSRLNEATLEGIAQSYSENGRGAMDLTITYDPVSKTNTAMRAGDEAARLSRSLRREGVVDVNTSILPVREQGAESVAIISYSSYKTAPPPNCTLMPGYDKAVLEIDRSYKIGCSLETTFAKQIADPSDLLGDARATPQTDGRRSTNIVEGYRTGAPNKPLEGVSATE